MRRLLEWQDLVNMGLAVEQRPDQAHVALPDRLDQVYLERFGPARPFDNVTGTDRESVQVYASPEKRNHLPRGRTQAVKGLCYNSLHRYAPQPRSTASLAGISGGVFVYFSVKMAECIKGVFQRQVVLVKNPDHLSRL
jgi:hypothetical protein